MHTTSNLYIYIYIFAVYCQQSKNEPGACTKCYNFTFYFLKAEQYTSGRVQNVGCVYAAAASTTLLLIIPGNQG